MHERVIFFLFLWKRKLPQKNNNFFARLGQQTSWSYEFEEMNQKRSEFGMVWSKSDQDGKKTFFWRRWWVRWVADATGTTRRKSSTRRGQNKTVWRRPTRFGGIRGQRVQDCLILEITIRWKDEERVLCTRIGTVLWQDGLYVKDGRKRVKDVRISLMRQKSSAKKL